MLVVIGGPIRNPIRMIGQCEQMRPKLSERHAPLDWHTVTNDVEIGSPKVDHPLAPRILHVRVRNVPFPRHSPVENLAAARNVMNLDRNVLLEDPQGLPNAVASDAPANRKQLGDKLIHFMPDVELIEEEVESRDVHNRIGYSRIKSRQLRSRWGMALGVSGHAIPNAGSFHLTPLACSGE